MAGDRGSDLDRQAHVGRLEHQAETVVAEDLNVTGMIAKRKLARAVSARA